MRKILLSLAFVLWSSNVWAQAVALPAYQGTSGSSVVTSAATPLPVRVYGGTNGQCLVSNGTYGVFTTCGGGGGSGTVTTVTAGTGLATSPALGITTTGSVSLLNATTTSLGGVIVGSGLSVSTTGVISATGSAPTISSLLGATTTNAIDNANWAQVWTWNTLTTQTALSLSSTSATSGKLIDSEITGNINSTGYAGYFTNVTTGKGYSLFALTTGAANTGYGVYAQNPSGTGWAGYFNGALQATSTVTLSKLTTGALMADGGGLITSGTLANSFLTNSSVTVNTNGVGLSGGGSVALGAVTTINGLYASTTVSGMSACGTGLSCSSTGVISITSGGVASPTQSLQYNNGGSFGGATGLYYSTTRAGLDLASTTTGNGISLGALGVDVTSLAVGPSALLAQTSTGNNNTAVGVLALTALTTGTNNTAVGYNAAPAVTVGGSVTAIGKDAGKLITGSNNTVLGALVASTTLTTGTSNIAIGTDSTTGFPLAATTSAIAIGTGSRAGSTDTAIGVGALIATTTNTNGNTAVGYLAGNAVTTGTNETMVGSQAGKLVTGAKNTIIGALVASTTLTTGASNVLIGADATTDTPLAITTSAIAIGIGARAGATDVSIGVNALATTVTDNLGNTAVGYNAMATGAVTAAAVQNVGIGSSALKALTLGSRNTAIGTSALTGTTSGNGNMAFGTSAGATVTTGTANTLIGRAVGGSTLTTGSNNIMIGGSIFGSQSADTILSSTSSSLAVGNAIRAGSGDTLIGHDISPGETSNGAHNTAVGYQAINASVSGTNNTVMGYQVGKLITGSNNTLFGAGVASTVLTSGAGNILIGTDSTTTVPLAATTSAVSIGTGSKAGNGDTAVGFQALLATITNANNNTGIGFKALTAATTGTLNTALGFQALKVATVQSANTAVGASAGQNWNGVGAGVTGIGYNILGASTSGLNTALGYEALQTVTTGTANTAVGYLSLSAVTNNTSNNTAVGDNTGLIVTTGGSNTILGAQVGSTVLTIGSNNVLIGTSNAITTTTSSASNEIHIGAGSTDIITVTGAGTPATADSTFNGQIFFPNLSATGVGDTYVCLSSGNELRVGATCAASDRGAKKNIIAFDHGLDWVMKIKGYYWDWNLPNTKRDGEHHIGPMAQDVAAIDPRLAVYQDGKPFSVDDRALLTAAITAIQEQQKEINDLKKQVEHR